MSTHVKDILVNEAFCDLIIDDPELELAVEGGPTGTEFTTQLLSLANDYLESNGSIYMILSSRMDKLETEWQKEIVKQEKYFFERLNLVRFNSF